MKKFMKNTTMSYAGSLFGAFLFVLGINVMIVPHGLYSGSMTGVAQMIESLLNSFAGIQAPEGSNLTGALLLLLNIPLMIMVLRVTNKSFPVKSIINIIFMNTILSLLPIPDSPIITDTLTSSMVGGVLSGFGAGFTLRNGGSGGGSDLIGVYCSVKYPNFTVGKASLVIGVIVYAYCFIAYDFNTVIYSAIFTFIYATVLDFTHHQNIKTGALIFTTNSEAMHSVMRKLKRGATHWEGKGGYSGQHTHIFITVVSKYEVAELKRVVIAADPRAFVVLSANVSVVGTFEKRL